MLGSVGPIASFQWHQGRWLDSARWLLHRTSVHLVRSVPTAGILVSALGLSLIWPAGIIVAFLAALLFLGVLFTSANRGAPVFSEERAAPRPVRAAPPADTPWSTGSR